MCCRVQRAGEPRRANCQTHDVRCGEMLDRLTDAEEGGEGNALPPPVREPQEAPGERGLPDRHQGDEAKEVARDHGFDRCAEREEKRAEEDVAEHVSGGPECVLLKKMFGNGIVDLLERERGRDERPGEPIPRVMSAPQTHHQIQRRQRPTARGASRSRTLHRRP